jgi:Xaa-Pro aminopeptidase
MFSASVYSNRRDQLKKIVKNGIILILGNVDVPMNYAANTYHFRQDSNFLYFFGIDIPGFAGIIDAESGEDYIFGNDVDIEDIIWMGNQPLVKELAEKCGISRTLPFSKLNEAINEKNTFFTPISCRK